MAESDPGPLTKAQCDIMEAVWAARKVTVTEVRDALAKKRELARNTIQTMMVCPVLTAVVQSSGLSLISVEMMGATPVSKRYRQTKFR